MNISLVLGCLVRTECPPSALYHFWWNGHILRIGLILKEMIRNLISFKGALEASTGSYYWDKTIGRGKIINLISPSLSSFLESHLEPHSNFRRILNLDHLVVPLVWGDHAPGSLKPSILCLSVQRMVQKWLVRLMMEPDWASIRTIPLALRSEVKFGYKGHVMEIVWELREWRIQLHLSKSQFQFSHR